ncbi:MAG TPA: lamin tail domain-containing protein, partial [Chitinophagaceae bacterium]|nr:lamin tail domain-containing protein [Chitinophagaceae bacterium]
MKAFLLILLLLPLMLLAQNRYDVVINEIMADPNPAVGLPENEWIELTNKTSGPIDLQGWRIGDENGISGPMPSFTLHPDSFVIVCGNSALTAMRQFGDVIAVSSFPSLGNDNDQLFVRSSVGYTVHAINYHSSWYANSLKKEGGWTLEMIDSDNPCGGSNNWKASNGVSGGSPGKKNSVQMSNEDKTPPLLTNAFTTDSATIILMFDEPVDSLAGSMATNYSIDGNLPIQEAMVLGPLFNQVQIRTGAALKADIVYTIRVENVVDCAGNNIGNKNEIRIGLPSEPVQGEWVINEILFNPRPNAYDYVEFYNNSNRIFDASRLYIANRNTSGTISSTRVLSELPFYVFPGDYLVVTEDGPGLSIHYLVRDQENVLTLPSLPSFP